MRRILTLLAISASLLTMLAGCPTREVARVEIAQNRQERLEIPVQLNRKLDILFVVDNSDSMRAEQESLAANFPRFVAKLEGIKGGLPDVHLGVISTDMGANEKLPDCQDMNLDDSLQPNIGGDNGLLQYQKRADCALDDGFLQDAFISDLSDPNNPDQRIRNYSGDLSEVFSCIAQLGTGGCGFEQPLEAMKQALSPGRNPGFIREDAYLAVIFITDEDDCSAANPYMFRPNDILSGLDQHLGPVKSYRCFEFGVQCDDPEDIPRQAGAKGNCFPRQHPPPLPADQRLFMADVDEYVAFLKGLKPDDPARVIVAGIIGDPEPVEVVREEEYNEQGEVVAEFFALEPSCLVDPTDPSKGDAAPPVRLKYFLDQFEDRNTFQTICKEDLKEGLTLVAELLREVVGNPCFGTNIDLDAEQPGLQKDCQVSDVEFVGEDPVSEAPISECSSLPPGPDDPRPCWFIRENQETCTAEPNLELVVERAGNEPPSDTRVVIHCVSGEDS